MCNHRVRRSVEIHTCCRQRHNETDPVGFSPTFLIKCSICSDPRMVVIKHHYWDSETLRFVGGLGWNEGLSLIAFSVFALVHVVYVVYVFAVLNFVFHYLFVSSFRLYDETEHFACLSRLCCQPCGMDTPKVPGGMHGNSIEHEHLR